jgi:hypothetical protein
MIRKLWMWAENAYQRICRRERRHEHGSKEKTEGPMSQLERSIQKGDFDIRYRQARDIHSQKYGRRLYGAKLTVGRSKGQHPRQRDEKRASLSGKNKRQPRKRAKNEWVQGQVAESLDMVKTNGVPAIIVTDPKGTCFLVEEVTRGSSR